MNKSTDYNDLQLIQRTAEGDEAAFTALYHAWHPRLGAFLFKLTESRELTEEILHDVFLKIWIARESLSGVTDFKNYVFVIARNHALNELNKLAVRLKYEQLYGEDQARREGSIDLHEEKTDKYFTIIDEAVAKLSGRQREVWWLSRVSRLSYKQIANKLNISAETVKSHLKSANSFIANYVRSRLHQLTLVLLSWLL